MAEERGKRPVAQHDRGLCPEVDEYGLIITKFFYYREYYDGTVSILSHLSNNLVAIRKTMRYALKLNMRHDSQDSICNSTLQSILKRLQFRTEKITLLSDALKVITNCVVKELRVQNWKPQRRSSFNLSLLTAKYQTMNIEHPQ